MALAAEDTRPYCPEETGEIYEAPSWNKHGHALFDIKGTVYSTAINIRMSSINGIVHSTLKPSIATCEHQDDAR